MYDRLQDHVFVVVAVFRPEDISETTWPTAVEAQRQRERLLELGVPADHIRIYRARVVRASSTHH